MAKFCNAAAAATARPGAARCAGGGERGVPRYTWAATPFVVDAPVRLQLVLAAHAMMGFLLCLPSAPAAILHIGLGGGGLRTLLPRPAAGHPQYAVRS